MPDVAFDKYEGTANDFVVVDLRGVEAAGALEPSRDAVASVCDRHRGVGADGVLFVTRGAPGADARMIVVNADGSRPEMCGNGLRCVALHLTCDTRATRETREEKREVVIDTDAGRRRCVVERASDDGAFVTVEMGRITVGEAIDVTFDGRPIRVRKADAGNPHAVTFDTLADHELDALGAQLQKSPIFPHGVNLERATLARDGSIRVEVFERGVGRTMACGTGACAVAAVALAQGTGKVGAPTKVVLPGGALEITLDVEAMALMRGPARRVFRGTLSLVRTLFTSGGAG